MMDQNSESQSGHFEESSAASSSVVGDRSSDVPARPIVPRNNRQYGTHAYWEDRFAEEESSEWLLSYKQLASQLEPYLKKTDCRILIVGCGNAPFSADMYDAGYKQLVNLDYSKNVIEAMKARHSSSRPEMEWIVMDMTDMSAFGDASFDVVIDKATTDALMTNEGDVWNPDASLISAKRSMCTHISRILRPGGHFLQISLAQVRSKRALRSDFSEHYRLSDAFCCSVCYTFKISAALSKKVPSWMARE
jgi:SAM-dependent methyltransferase